MPNDTNADSGFRKNVSIKFQRLQISQSATDLLNINYVGMVYSGNDYNDNDLIT